MKNSFCLIILASLLFSCASRTLTTNTLAIDRLIDGNKRYQSNHPLHPDQTRQRLKEVSSSQHPFAVVVSCSDSRVPPELVFDQGLGDLFVIRTAGHAIGQYELASIEYAVEHLNVSNVIVLGHENCGAIKTLLEHPQDSLPGHLEDLVEYLKNEPEEKDLKLQGLTHLKDAILANINHGVSTIVNSKPILTEKVAKKELNVFGAYYQLSDGKVELIQVKNQQH